MNEGVKKVSTRVCLRTKNYNKIIIIIIYYYFIYKQKDFLQFIIVILIIIIRFAIYFISYRGFYTYMIDNSDTVIII